MNDSQSQEVSLKDELDLRASLQEAISNICVEEEIDDASAHLSTDGLVALSELVYHYATTSLSSDLRLFSKHAGRRTIQVDDVLLAARKDPEGLLAKLRSFGEKQDMPAFRNTTRAPVAAAARSNSANRTPPKTTTAADSSIADPWLNIDSSSDEEQANDDPDDETQTDEEMNDGEEKMPAKEATARSGGDSVIELDDSFDYSDVADTAKENVASNRKDNDDEKDPFESSSDEDETLTARLKRLGKAKANPAADFSSNSSLSPANSPRRKQKSRLDADSMMDDDLSD